MPHERVRKIAFVADHLPRKCGIATFTSDLLAAVAAAHPQSQCFSVSVNDIPGGYDYPEVVRFEIEEQDLSSYLAPHRTSVGTNTPNVPLTGSSAGTIWGWNAMGKDSPPGTVLPLV